MQMTGFCPESGNSLYLLVGHMQGLPLACPRRLRKEGRKGKKRKEGERGQRMEEQGSDSIFHSFPIFPIRVYRLLRKVASNEMIRSLFP